MEGVFEEMLLPRAVLYCWGRNDQGQLSIASTKAANLPRESRGYSGQPLQVCSSKEHSALVNSEGHLYVTGSTLFGKLGLEDNMQNNVTRFVRLRDMVVRQVALGDFHTICLLNDYKVFAWGGTLHGKVGQRSGKPS
jgi:alpha-tubulin suppressor-like RCC1 family protein